MQVTGRNVIVCPVHNDIQILGREDRGVWIPVSELQFPALCKWRENGTMAKVVHGAYRWIYATHRATDFTTPERWLSEQHSARRWNYPFGEPFVWRSRMHCCADPIAPPG
jgi:hypothetical protein